MDIYKINHFNGFVPSFCMLSLSIYIYEHLGSGAGKASKATSRRQLSLQLKPSKSCRCRLVHTYIPVFTNRQSARRMCDRLFCKIVRRITVNVCDTDTLYS